MIDMKLIMQRCFLFLAVTLAGQSILIGQSGIDLVSATTDTVKMEFGEDLKQTFSFNNQVSESRETRFLFDPTIIKRVGNDEKYLSGFRNSLSFEMELVNVSDQERRRHIIFATEIEGKSEVVLIGVWKNPNPKGLSITPPSAKDLRVVGREDTLVDGKITKTLSFLLKNKSSEELRVVPVVNEEPEEEKVIPAEGTLTYTYELNIDIQDTLKKTVPITLVFKNSKFEDVMYNAGVINLEVEIEPKTDWWTNITQQDISLILQGLILFLVIYAVVLWPMLIRRVSKGSKPATDHNAVSPANNGKEGGASATSPNEKDELPTKSEEKDEEQKSARKKGKKNTKKVDDSNIGSTLESVAKDTKNLKAALTELKEQVAGVVDKETISGLIRTQIEDNNSIVSHQLVSLMQDKNLLKNQGDFDNERLVEGILSKLEVDGLSEAIGALEKLQSQTDGQKIEEVLWAEGIAQFKREFRQLDSVLEANDYYGRSRVSREDFKLIEGIDDVVSGVGDEELLKILTKVIRITCWKTKPGKLDNEEMLQFFYQIKKRMEGLRYGRRMMEDALSRKGIELVVPELFDWNPTDPDSYRNAPAAPVMQGDGRSLQKEWNLDQGTVYDIFCVGIKRASGEVVQKPVVSRIP